MEFNNPSEIVKDLTFGKNAREKIMTGVEKLYDAVSSTLGASGRCVIYEDAMGKPVITKDGVTVAESVVLLDPIENIGATLIKEAAKNTVKEAGDGTTTATVLAYALLKIAGERLSLEGNTVTIRELKDGIKEAADNVVKYLEDNSIPVVGDMLYNVAQISCNNDKELGTIIADAFKEAGNNGVVLWSESDSNETYIDTVEGVQFDSGLKSPHFVTDTGKEKCELDKPYVLLVTSPITNVRKIQNVLEYVIKGNNSLLIIASLEAQPFQTILANKVKGVINVNVIDVPGFGPTRQDSIEDMALLTGAKIINEELGDDLDFIDPSVLGRVDRAVTDSKTTVLQLKKNSVDQEKIDARIKEAQVKLKKEKNPFIEKKIEQRLGILSGKVAIIKVGADSKVELKEKKDRVEDSVYAVKAALKEGVVAGGGIALLNAAKFGFNPTSSAGSLVLYNAISAPAKVVLSNADMLDRYKDTWENNYGINVVTGKQCNMIEEGILDPVLVTKTALHQAISVVQTILSADCVISNKRA